MNTDTLSASIKKVSSRIPDEDIPVIAGWAKKRELKKGEVLLNEGQQCREFYLVEKGYLRTWCNKDGTEINLNFTFEGDFTTNLKSLNDRLPSEVYIEAGEAASVWVFDLEGMREKRDMYPEIVLFVRRLSVHILLAAEAHNNLFKTHTPTERYLHIEQNNPKLLQRISLSQLASYLGVTRETLSRIRGKRH